MKTTKAGSTQFNSLAHSLGIPDPSGVCSTTARLNNYEWILKIELFARIPPLEPLSESECVEQLMNDENKTE